MLTVSMIMPTHMHHISTLQPAQSEQVTREGALTHASLLGRFEDSIRQHERACAERSALEERLRIKLEEYQQMKDELETIKDQIQDSSMQARSKISDSQSEISDLKDRIDKLRAKIEEQAMQAKRGRNMLAMATEKLFTHLAQVSQKKAEIEEQYKAVVEEKEAAENKPKNSLDVEIIREGHVFQLFNEELFNHKLEKWRDLGFSLGFSEEELNDIERCVKRKHNYQERTCSDPERSRIYSTRQYEFQKSCAKRMLIHWTTWYPGDSRGSTGFPIHPHLIRALIESGYGFIAGKLLPYSRLIEAPSYKCRETPSPPSSSDDYVNYSYEKA